jgi:hypothetical protein
MLTGDFGEFSGQSTRERFKSLKVGGGKINADVVRSDRGAVNPHRALSVDYSGKATANLHRLQPTAKSFTERSLNESL